ncbi:MAG: NAD(+) synthase [Desulfobacterales bacterium]|jgi:NAD+ synthase|nr:NAD(+) synthase [Desulfobacterales bacterium]
MQTAKVIDYIVNWLNTSCDGAGLNGFVVGISGGIDSAVTSSLCATTGKRTLVLNMQIYQAPHQVDLALQHMAWLKQKYPHVEDVNIDLTDAFQTIEKTFPSAVQDGLTMANTRARLRMLTLYAFAGHHRLLVAGTGNKVEDFGVGFYTKYGDGGVDVSPIADLMKSEVYAIGRYLGIIDGILNAPPTDGLWHDNRSDESQIGASYDELEWAMGFANSGGDERTLDGRQKKVLEIYRKFRRMNRHKMEPIPVAKIPDEMRR